MKQLDELIAKFKELLRSSEKKHHENYPADKKKEPDTQLMSDDEKIDQALKESFPASDPPGHILKSAEDLKQY